MSQLRKRKQNIVPYDIQGKIDDTIQLNEEETQSLLEYCGGSYSDINDFLCNKVDGCSDSVLDTIETIESIFERANTFKDVMILYRGVRIYRDGLNKCYMSTSLSKRVALDFALEHHYEDENRFQGTILMLIVNPGIKYINLQRITDERSEGEILLERDLTLNVINTYIIDGITHYTINVTK